MLLKVAVYRYCYETSASSPVPHLEGEVLYLHEELEFSVGFDHTPFITERGLVLHEAHATRGVENPHLKLEV